MKKGKFIVFDGIDGAGKTTQLDMLARRMTDDGESVYITAEPTGSDIGRLLRSALSGADKRSECEMAVMFVLDRIAHNNAPDSGIRALVENGTDIICDRYYYSSLAYQGSSTDYEWVKSLNLRCPEIRKPDLCIFLDLTPEQSLERITRGRDKLEIFENVETLTKVRERFFSTIVDLCDENIAVIDAYRTPEEIAEDIWSLYKSI